jgi:hypothetical protein
MQTGERRAWKIEHAILIGNEHGEVQVTRVFTTRLATCKELVFSVESGSGAKATRSWYTAEPAVERWGTLQ